MRRPAIQLRVIDHETEQYRYELQRRNPFLCVFPGWWQHVSTYHMQEKAIEAAQEIEDAYNRRRSPSIIFTLDIKR